MVKLGCDPLSNYLVIFIILGYFIMNAIGGNYTHGKFSRLYIQDHINFLHFSLKKHLESLQTLSERRDWGNKEWLQKVEYRMDKTFNERRTWTLSAERSVTAVKSRYPILFDVHQVRKASEFTGWGSSSQRKSL